MISAEPILETVVCDLGEGPFWDARSNRLGWVDIHGSRLYLAAIPDGPVERYRFDDHVGMASPRSAGGWIVAIGRRIASFDSAELEVLVRLESEPVDNRCNDGACDPEGRLWIGTMAYDLRERAGSLYRISKSASVVRVLSDVTVSNGIDWSPDGSTMYYVDTPTGQIDSFDYDRTTGAIDNRRVFVAVDNGVGQPDGLCTDYEGGVWVALWGGGQVRRFTPEGSLDAIVDLSASHPTSCCFGDPNGETLFITTAKAGQPIQKEPPSSSDGMMHACRPGVSGPPAKAFEG